MNEIDNNKIWDTFYDELNWSKYHEEGNAVLRREYVKGTSYIKEYMSHPDLAPTVAKGITAFLSFWSHSSFRSFRLLLIHNERIDLENFFTSYSTHCLKFMSNEEERNPFKNERKSKTELALIHLENEEQFFIESKQFFDEVREWERPISEKIKKATLYYHNWLKQNYAKEENQNKPELTISQIALKYFYEGKSITRINGDEIAKHYGWKSGEGLYQQFSYFSSTANRKGKPNPDTPIKMKNKIELFESVYELLPEANKQRAFDELNILKGIYKSEYE